MIKRMIAALAILAVLIWTLAHLFRTTPTSFVQNEDQGYIMGMVIMPDSATLTRTAQTSGQVDEFFAKNPAVENRTIVNGFSLIDAQYKPNVSTFFVTFKDFEERYASKERARTESAEAVLRTVAGEARRIDTGLFIPIAPPAIPGIGTTGGFEFWIQDKTSGDPARLNDLVQQVLAKARQRPELTGLSTTFRAASQQLRADVDRPKAVLLGVPVGDVYSTMQAQFGSIQVSQFNQYSRVWNVMLQSDAPFRRSPEDLTRLYVRSVILTLVTSVATSYVNLCDLDFPFVPAGLPSAILENRPDIRQAEQGLVAANANIGVARAQYFPSISLTGSVGTASADLSDLFTGPSKTWSYGGNLTVPIFTAGAPSRDRSSRRRPSSKNAWPGISRRFRLHPGRSMTLSSANNGHASNWQLLPSRWTRCGST